MAAGLSDQRVGILTPQDCYRAVHAWLAAHVEEVLGAAEKSWARACLDQFPTPDRASDSAIIDFMIQVRWGVLEWMGPKSDGKMTMEDYAEAVLHRAFPS